MKTLDKVLPRVLPDAAEKTTGKAPQKTKATAGSARSDVGGRDMVDAINQLFVELELAYHNQFHKAYAQDGSLNLAKKYWLTCLGDFTPEVILRAVRQLVRSQEYLPSVAAMVAACENAFSLFGLPPAHAAYVEACCAAEPKALQKWSHPAVYRAGRETGWFALATETQSVIFPVFEYNYQQLCKRVLHGESLEFEVPPALPSSIPAPLTLAENQSRLKQLREQFDL